MRVLVTGGAGFIGSHIVESLLQEGIELAVLDNLSTGKREHVPKGVYFYKVDLRDREGLERVFREFRPTHVSHQAAQASVKVSVDNPLLDFEVNLLGGLNLLEAMRKWGTEKIVFASTGGAIYGEVPEGEEAEETWPPKPKSPYAASKAGFEHYLSAYGQNYGLKWVSLR
ncbi:MAG: NAD-dependent epimerase/dehydratase family protein, partial [Thermus caldifontis]